MLRSTALLLSACAFALPLPAAAQTFSPERIRADVSYLADDLLEGRNAGTRGYDLAAKFVASRFDALGMKPGAAGNSYFQAVPFVQVGLKNPDKAAFTIGGQRFVNGLDSVIGASPIFPSQSEEVEVVFVGYGLEDKRFGLDDYAGLDVKGKVVATITAPRPMCRVRKPPVFRKAVAS